MKSEDTGLAVAYAGLINQEPWFGNLVAGLDNSGQLKVTAVASAAWRRRRLWLG